MALDSAVAHSVGDILPGFRRLGRRRICFIIDSLTGGGAERVISAVASALDPAKYETQIVLTLGREVQLRPADHVPIVVLPDSPCVNTVQGRWARRLDRALALALLPFAGAGAGNVRATRNALAKDIQVFRTMSAVLGEHICDWRPDCIVSFLPNSNLIALLAKASYSSPAVLACSDRNYLSSEMPKLPWPILRRALTRRLYPQADAHIAVAPGVANDLHANFRVQNDRIRTIVNGVDIARLQQLADVPASMRGPASVPRLLAVGRLSRQKGFDILLQALGRIKNLAWQLSMLGVGEEEMALRQLAREQGIADRVEFVGWQPNPYVWMQHSTLLVMSSRWEGMPNVLLEAMALGLPVVATDCPTGPRLILDGGRVGRLVENGSARELADAIAGLLASPGELRRLGGLAREHCRHYSTEAMIERYRELIDDLIASSGTRLQG